MRNTPARAPVALGMAGRSAAEERVVLRDQARWPDPKLASEGARVEGLQRRLTAQAADVERALASMEAELRRLRTMVEHVRARSSPGLDRHARMSRDRRV